MNKHKRSKVKVSRLLCSPLCWHSRQLQRWAWECVGHGSGKLLLRCRLFSGTRHFGAHGEERGRGISWRPPAYGLLIIKIRQKQLHYLLYV